MATVVDHLVISLGLDPRPLQSGLNQVKSLAMRFAGPIAGAFSIHKVFQNYVESVSWVAKVTGGYFEKLENYKYKMAMLARVTREDIEVYRKYREALVKFNITMGDLSMKIMREFYPVFRTMIDGLNKFSDWVDRNHDNIHGGHKACLAHRRVLQRILLQVGSGEQENATIRSPESAKGTAGFKET